MQLKVGGQALLIEKNGKKMKTEPFAPVFKSDHFSPPIRAISQYPQHDATVTMFPNSHTIRHTNLPFLPNVWSPTFLSPSQISVTDFLAPPAEKFSKN